MIVVIPAQNTMNATESPAKIEVSPEPAFLEQHSDPAQHRYVFSYTITLRNVGDVPAQLLERHWLITHADGRIGTGGETMPASVNAISASAERRAVIAFRSPRASRAHRRRRPSL